MQQRYIPMSTKMGIMVGRDAIHLDKLTYMEEGARLTVVGAINGRLGSIPLDEFVDYQLVFHGVNSFTVIDNDVADDDGMSCFDEVLHSQWKAKWGEAFPDAKHYSLSTYDRTIDVLCKGYKISYEAN